MARNEQEIEEFFRTEGWNPSKRTDPDKTIEKKNLRMQARIADTLERIADILEDGSAQRIG